MQDYTERRNEASPDEIRLLEHPSVFTLGLNGKPEHLLEPGAIPVVKVDRGGQVTYHGPGQLIAYTLVDLKRANLGVRAMVTLLETAVIDLLCDFGIEAHARREAPGVYVQDKKIAALGLRVRRGCCYHGLALNVDMDLAPFQRINPCGYPGLGVTQCRELGIDADVQSMGEQLLPHLLRGLKYT
ncbi:MAG: lipoyl(octanoyl) transferase LipB [Chromatiales bacterium]|nr:lipoyl(octanoyl) transferase LipB [Chromatiales bacterium]